MREAGQSGPHGPKIHVLSALVNNFVGTSTFWVTSKAEGGREHRGLVKFLSAKHLHNHQLRSEISTQTIPHTSSPFLSWIICPGVSLALFPKDEMGSCSHLENAFGTLSLCGRALWPTNHGCGVSRGHVQSSVQILLLDSVQSPHHYQNEMPEVG